MRSDTERGGDRRLRFLNRGGANDYSGADPKTARITTSYRRAPAREQEASETAAEERRGAVSAGERHVTGAVHNVFGRGSSARERAGRMARWPGEGAPEDRKESSSRATAIVSSAHESEPLSVRRRAPRLGAASHEPTIAEMAWTLVERRWTILAIATVFVAGAAAYLYFATPIYESSVLIQVESRSKPVTAFEDLVDLFQEETPTEGEIRIMKSRALLEDVAERLRLDVTVSPRTFPVIGAAYARRHSSGNAPAPAPFGLDRFAWGGERIRVDQLDVPDGLLGAPFVLTALDGSRYRVATSDGAVLLEGAVGGKASGSGAAKGFELKVSELTARRGTEFTLLKRPRLDVVEELQGQLRVSEQGRLTGLVEVAYSSPDPARIAEILDAVSSTYRRQSIERTSAEAAKTLTVLEAQLPALRSNVEKAERALDAFHLRNGAVNLSTGAEDLVRRLGETDRAIAENELKRTELSNRFTERHPDVAVLSKKAAQLNQQRASLEQSVRQLPRLDVESTRLTRELRVATDLYMLVLNRAQELRIVTSGWIGNARVLEHSVAPRHPARPKPRFVLAIAIALGLAGGIAAAFIRAAWDHGVRDPGEIETSTGLPVMGTIPRSAAQRKLERGSGKLAALSVVHPGDPATEELRALRTSVQFALLRSRNNIIAIGGLTPKAGKSLVSVNLAQLLAAAEGRVLLVDGDLRRGALHRFFGVAPQPGLAEVVTGAATLEAALHATETPNLDLLPAGRFPENPAELLASPAFEALLAEVGRRYKAVIVDTPPILAVTDSALVGRHAGTNLLVLRAGEHSLGEIVAALRRFAQSGVTIKGAVLNDVRSWGRYGRSAPYYRYEFIRSDQDVDLH
jgi:tyrosine-protein kinase Etk/Wzc